MEFPPIDTVKIRKDFPLTAIAGQDVELHFKKDGSEARGPCPYCQEGDDRFAVFVDDMTFNCRRCHAHGDVLQYIQDREQISFVEAAYHLIGKKASTKATNGKLVGRPNGSKPLSGDLFWEWSNKLEVLTTQAHAHLIERRCEGAAAAAQWLEGRGIDQKLIEDHGIGYNDRWRQIIPDYKLPPGVTLPRWRAKDNAITACNVYLNQSARETTGCKRMFAKGSQAKTFLNEWRIPFSKTVVITEGELDTILLSKFLPPFALAITTGGAQTIPDSLSILKGRRVVLALDNDEAGEQGREKWLEELPNATVADIPGHKDITDAWRAGVKLDKWINGHLKREP
jgi:DNA primase